jgi:hypothetical protein
LPFMGRLMFGSGVWGEHMRWKEDGKQGNAILTMSVDPESHVVWMYFREIRHRH